MKKLVNHICAAVAMKTMNLRQRLAEQRAGDYVDTAIRTLIMVVLGALLLAGLYALFNDTVLPIPVYRV